MGVIGPLSRLPNAFKRKITKPQRKIKNCDLIQGIVVGKSVAKDIST